MGGWSKHYAPIIPEIQAIARGTALWYMRQASWQKLPKPMITFAHLDFGDAIIIRDGRHPVVEQGVFGAFVLNDTDCQLGTQVMIITGANMAGKSTYMRAVASSVLWLRQEVLYLPGTPVSEFWIGIHRVGAFDDLASGQSTFFVEMLELANILNNITPRSLVILDEIGRGTSTVDGCSIAKAGLEYLHGKPGAAPKTLFATHFHELVEVESVLKRVKNYHFAVKETKNEVIFLRKLIPGD